MNKRNKIDAYLKVNKFFLSLVGQWPYQLPRERIFFRIVCHGICTLILIPATIASYDIRHDTTEFVESIPPLFTVLASYCYAIFFSSNMSKMKVLTESMRNDWLSNMSSTEHEILKRSAQKGKYLSTMFAIYCYISSTIYVLIPLLPTILDVISPLDETRTKIYVFRVNYLFIRNENYYYFIYLHAILATYLTLANIIAIDIIFLCTVQHACGMFQILGHRLKYLVEGNNTYHCDIDKDKEINRKLVRCIQLYNNILKFIENIEFTFSTMFLFIIGINMLAISFQGVQIVLNLNNSEILMRFGSFFIGQIIHLYFNTIPGQMLIDESSKVNQYCYECNWTDMTTKSQRLLLFMLLRASRECKVSAGKVYIISMENFSSVIKTSFSYLSVLSSAQ